MFLLVQISDLHIRPRGLPVNRISETNTLTERAIDVIRLLEPKPQAVLVTGDITDSGTEREYERARILLDRLHLPYFLIPGNHDRRRAMQAAFADLDWMPKEGPIRFAVEVGDRRLICLDTLVEGEGGGRVGEEQLAWLDAELARHGERPTIIALHHPPIRTGIVHMDKIALADANAFVAVVARHAQIERILCGHLHRPITASIGGRTLIVPPSVVHQVALDLDPAHEGAFNFEPPAYYLHLDVGAGLVSHMAYVERYPGPYPFGTDGD